MYILTETQVSRSDTQDSFTEAVDFASKIDFSKSQTPDTVR